MASYFEDSLSDFAVDVLIHQISFAASSLRLRTLFQNSPRPSKVSAAFPTKHDSSRSIFNFWRFSTFVHAVRKCSPETFKLGFISIKLWYSDTLQIASSSSFHFSFWRFGVKETWRTRLKTALEIFQLQTLDDFVRATTFANFPFRNCPYPTQVLLHVWRILLICLRLLEELFPHATGKDPCQLPRRQLFYALHVFSKLLATLS